MSIFNLSTATVVKNVSDYDLATPPVFRGEFLEYRLNEHFTQRAFEQEFGSDATYPQVLIGARHVGNLKETLQHMKERGMIK